MRRRDLLKAASLFAVRPADAAPAPISEPHFPSRLHQFVWRNWELANLDRMARILGARPQDLASIGASMGLPAKRVLSKDQLSRIYITVIRQNWHMLPEDQIIDLLGWTRERFDFTLKEDDFLDVKLGNHKPACDRLVYSPPGPADSRHAAAIRKLIRAELRGALDSPGEAAFDFLDEYRRPVPHPPAPAPAKALWDPRIVYSFFALYGDPLLEPESDPFPDAYLDQLARAGINGVWMQAVLNNLAPAPAFPEFGRDWEKRIAQLNILIERAGRFGIRLFLYLNEPRAMPSAFFDNRPGIRGSFFNGVYSMCTSEIGRAHV